MTKTMKTLRVRGEKLLQFVLMVSLMSIVWMTMYRPSIAPQTTQMTTTAVSLC